MDRSWSVWGLGLLLAAGCGSSDAASSGGPGGPVAQSGGAGSTTTGNDGSSDGGESVTGGAASGGGGNSDDTQAAGGTGPSSGAGGTSSGGAPATASGGATSTGSGDAPSDAVPSSGCASTPSLTSGHQTIDVGGTEREYIISIPAGYDPSHPYPLLFGFHGRMYDAQWVAGGEPPLTGPYFGIQDASNDSMVFVAAQALSSSWTNEGGRDIDYVEAMHAALARDLCIDESRVFAVGFSMGAIMTATIGCELYDSFRAVAPMSASLPATCSDGLPALAYWGSHGLSDPTIPIAQGEIVRDSYVARNHCASTTSDPDENNCISYEGCDDGSPAVWCTFEGVHEPAPFAGPGIWKFLSQF